MYCTKCGHEHRDGAKYCDECGCLLTEGSKTLDEVNIRPHKCLSCGESIDAFCSVCPSCGAEIVGKRASEELKTFACSLEFASSEKQKINLISNYVIPNTKEDICEFLMFAVSMFDMDYHLSHLEVSDVSDAWLAKIEQCYQKARLTFADSPEFAQVKSVYLEIKNERTGRIRIKTMRDSVKKLWVAFWKKCWIGVVALAAVLTAILIAMPKPISLDCIETDFVGKSEAYATSHFKELGFTNLSTSIVYSAEPDIADGAVANVTINGEDGFDKGDRFSKKAEIVITVYEKPIAVGTSSEEMKGFDRDTLVTRLCTAGFINVSTKAQQGDGEEQAADYVAHVTINGDMNFAASDVYPKNATIIVYYYVIPIAVTMDAKDLVKKNLLLNRGYEEVVAILEAMGFQNIHCQPVKKGAHSEGATKSVSIGGNEEFSAGDRYMPDVEIVVFYYSKKY